MHEVAKKNRLIVTQNHGTRPVLKNYVIIGFQLTPSL